MKMMCWWYKNEILGCKRSKKLFLKVPFYNFLFEKPPIKHLKNKDLLHELPFYDELNIEKISKAFKGYARTYKIEIINLKDALAQLEASKSSNKDCLRTLIGLTKNLVG